MGLRRERPSQETGSGSLNLRLGDGSTVSVSLDPHHQPAASEVCCFCGEALEPSDPRHLTLSARRADDPSSPTQTWSAHESCLAERLHERVRGDDSAAP